MSTLNFRSSAAFAQSLRMRRNGAPAGTRFLIVEGASDKKSFHPLLDPGLHYVPARGKDMVLSAYKTLTSEGVEDCLFVVDCDGGTDSSWLGRQGLIVSNNRDIDADLLFDLKAFDRVSLEYLSDFGLTAQQCAEIGGTLLDYARQITANFGILLDGARDTGANTKFMDPILNARRKIRLHDFPELQLWVRNFVPVSPEELLSVASPILGWDASDENVILERLEKGAEKRCRNHGQRKCLFCTPRRVSHGHDLVDVLALGISQRCGFHVTEAEFARATRLATSQDAIANWDVAIRIRKWQSGQLEQCEETHTDPDRSAQLVRA